MHITFVNYIQNFIQCIAFKVNSTCRGNYWGIISVVFIAASQLLIIHTAFVKYLRKNGNTMEQCISYL
jgi:hypothetical protein